MKVLIIGASGLIGGNCLRHFRDHLKWECEGTYYGFPVDGCHFYDTLQDDKKGFDPLSFVPDLILHCGALTHVDYCEEHPEESYQKTVISTSNLLSIALKCKSAFAYISTDYVFDGKSGPYREEDKISPLSVYGRHKAEAEGLVSASGLPYLICRVTNVYGDEFRGKNFVSRLISDAGSDKRSQLNLPGDQYATPVNAADVAKALGELIRAGKKGLYHLASTDYLNRFQLASMVLRRYPNTGITAKSVLTSELGQSAKRPLNGGLIAAKFLSEFPSFNFGNVHDYIDEKLYKN